MVGKRKKKLKKNVAEQIKAQEKLGLAKPEEVVFHLNRH
jgi:cell division protein FtsB